MGDPEFLTWWGDHRVAVRTAGTKALRHPVVGRTRPRPVRTDRRVRPGPHRPDRRARHASHDGLRLLGVLAAAPST
ncbi:hypothetical protein AB0D13_12820 [Streptomyces sp. NPDC048430]|uniref:MmyB family transcriptional regulator n=1 Tax=Streptomyces sp. NPDC048430 TaxID=3155388 RepID=UPI00342FC648